VNATQTQTTPVATPAAAVVAAALNAKPAARAAQSPAERKIAKAAKALERAEAKARISARKAADKAARAARKAAAKAAKPAHAPKAKRDPNAPLIKRIGDTRHDLSRYQSAKSASGNASLDCGDSLAVKLRGLSLDDVYKLASKELREPQTALRAKYAHLNVGMQRMNLGNRIRGAMAEGTEE
jgi:sRNA-binding protein